MAGRNKNTPPAGTTKNSTALALVVLAFIAGAALVYVMQLQQSRQAEGALRQHEDLGSRLESCKQSFAEQNLNYTYLLSQYNARAEQIASVNKKIGAAQDIINDCYARLGKYENLTNASG